MLMEAEIALFSSKQNKPTFVSAHLERAKGVLNRENSKLTLARGCPVADVAEAAEYLINFMDSVRTSGTGNQGR